MSKGSKESYLKPDSLGENITIALSRPTKINGVGLDKVTMRTPTIGDVRAAQRQGKGDKEQEEFILFASLLDCGIDDMERFSVRDYKRLNDAYFRLTDESDAESGGTARALPAAGA
jgi:hypothetical protein